MPVAKDGPRINEDIRVREVHLIDKDGSNRGNISIAEAELRAAVPAKGHCSNQRNSKRRRQPFVAR